MDENKVESIIFGLKETIAEKDKEIERLTEENAILKGNPPMCAGRSNGKTIRAKLLAFDRMKEQNAELQKQVDELTAENTRLNKCVMSEEQVRKCCADIIQSTRQQAVKDTAKEIFQNLYNETIKNGIPAVYCMLTPKEIKDRAKRYGVEVE